MDYKQLVASWLGPSERCVELEWSDATPDHGVICTIAPRNGKALGVDIQFGVDTVVLEFGENATTEFPYWSDEDFHEALAEIGHVVRIVANGELYEEQALVGSAVVRSTLCGPGSESEPIRYISFVSPLGLLPFLRRRTVVYGPYCDDSDSSASS
jgi:hypothetical protein